MSQQKFHVAGYATGRMSSSKPNLQNIPINAGLGREVRDSLFPPYKKQCLLDGGSLLESCGCNHCATARLEKEEQ